MRTLPTFIFLDENHVSGKLASVIAKMLPALKEAGYNDFAYEIPPDTTLEAMTRNLETAIKDNTAFKQQLPKLTEDFIAHLRSKEIINQMIPGYVYTVASLYLIEQSHSADKSTSESTIIFAMIMQMTKQLLGNQVNTEIIEQIFNEVQKNFLLTPDFRLNYIDMLHAIDTAQMRLHGIDHASMHLDTFNSNSFEAIDKIADLMSEKNKDFHQKRDKTMATAYLQLDAPVIGYNGVMHTSGLQNYINNRIPSDIAQANFDFIYIYRDELQHAPLPALGKIWEDHRQRNVPLPLGLTLIDGIGKTDDEIAEMVMQHIHERIAQFKALPDHLKVIPDISLTGQVRAQFTKAFGFFSQTAEEVRDAVAHKIWGEEAKEENTASAATYNKPC